MPSAEWLARQRALVGHFSKGDDFSKPWRWSTIIATCFVGEGQLLTSSLFEMRQNGTTPPVWEDEDAPNLMLQRYHLWRWERNQGGVTVARLRSIQEFGGGYGAMAIVAARLGFRGAYSIEDLPEFARMQDMHLAHRGLPFRVRHKRIKKPDLLIALFSLDETPLDERAAWMARVRPRNFLFAWTGGEHQPWFEGWAQANYERTRTPYRVEQGPTGSSHTYLMSYQAGR